MAVIIIGWQAATGREEIRKVSGDREATPLDTDRVVTGRPAQGERLHPEIVLGFHGLCLVKAANDDWYMGSLNDDGSVTCWSVYNNLYEALRGLLPVPTGRQRPSQFPSHSAPFTAVQTGPGAEYETERIPR